MFHQQVERPYQGQFLDISSIKISTGAYGFLDDNKSKSKGNINMPSAEKTCTQKQSISSETLFQCEQNEEEGQMVPKPAPNRGLSRRSAVIDQPNVFMKKSRTKSENFPVADRQTDIKELPTKKKEKLKKVHSFPLSEAGARQRRDGVDDFTSNDKDQRTRLRIICKKF